MKLTLSAAMALLTICAGFSQTNIASLPGISSVQAMGGKVFFPGTHDTYGQELFVSNGSAGNFSLVKDINPGRDGSTPADFTVLNNELFFTAYSPEYGLSLWKSDGTPQGTKVAYNVKDASPQNLFAFKGKLYFTTNLGSIICTDGTSAGTKVFYQAGFTWGRVQTVIANDEYIYFTTDGRKIFRDNGSSRVSFLGPLSWEDVYFKKLFIVGNSLVAIKASSYDNMIRIYAISNSEIVDDGDAEWPVIKKLDAPIYGSQELESFTNVAGKLFFNFRTDYDNVEATDELWITDATEAGTKKLKSFSWDNHLFDSEMNLFYSLNGKLFFRGGGAVNKALWTSDGTPEGTVKFHDVVITWPSYNQELSPLLVTDNQVHFSGTLGSTAGLWTSDGTAAGTKQVFSLESMGGSAPHDFAASNDLVYFVTSQQFSSTLWSSLPTADISVSSYGPLSSGSTLGAFWGVPIGSCQTVDITIANKGLETLYLDNVTLSGKDFYLIKQILPEKLAPEESVTTQVVFNPITGGKSTGTLTIRSSDEDEPTFIVYLSATPSTFAAPQACAFDQSNYVKTLTTNQPNSAIVLSASTIAEGQPQGTVIGEFILPVNGTFSLVTGEGDTDNELFSVDGKSVKSNAVFNFDQKSLYSIRVRATSGGNDMEASLRIRVTNGSRGFEEGNCRETFEYMNFSYLALEANAEGHLFATTSNGKILRSKDDGQHWEVVYAGNQYLRLSEITFIGNTAIVQGNYALLKSDDGGATWFHLYLPLTGEYYYTYPAIFFFDEHTGYAATSAGEIFFTNDGGQTWETRMIDSWREFRNLFFLSLETGYATSNSGELYKTADGGKSWKVVDLSSFGWSTRVRDLWFTNDADGFMLTEYNLYRTSDGGQTWLKIPDIGTDFEKIKFYGEDVGYLYSGSSYLYRTSDGGKSWTALSPGIFPTTTSGLAETGGKIFIVNKGYYSNNESARAMAMSSNNGATWSRLNYFSDSNLYQIEFSTGNKGFVIGESGFFKTQDNGLTWDQAATDLSAVQDILFLDENKVILLSGGDLYKSTNGGTTTRSVLTTPQSTPYYPAGKLYSAPGNVLFSMSWYAVYRSDDLGETWTLVSTDPGYYTQGMHFVSSAVGYRIELFGSIEKTTNGGKNWTRIFTRDPGDANVFNAIFYLDENVGYSGGTYLRKTDDGGKTWQKINWAFYDIIAIHFENVAHGYVATRGGIVHETLDAGETWQEILNTSSIKIADIQFRGNEIFIAGEAGLAVRTNTTPRPPSMPGYISGPHRICAGDAVDFHLAIESGYQTQWSTTAGNMEDHDHYATINFPSPGEYTITARHFNACGTSDLRTTTVTVSTPQETPIIDGPNPVTPGDQDIAYTVTNGTENASYFWEVTGSTNISPSENAVLVDWSTNARSGDIKVLSIDASGCRSFSNLAIILKEVPLSVEAELTQQVRVYPNPTAETDTKLVSSYHGALSVRVIDVVGREYLRTSISSGEEQSIPTRSLPAGLYLIEISNGVRLATKKLIKQ